METIHGAKSAGGGGITLVADIAARDAIANPKIGEQARVASNSEGFAETFVWNGTSWVTTLDVTGIQAASSAAIPKSAFSAGGDLLFREVAIPEYVQGKTAVLTAGGTWGGSLGDITNGLGGNAWISNGYAKWRIDLLAEVTVYSMRVTGSTDGRGNPINLQYGPSSSGPWTTAIAFNDNSGDFSYTFPTPIKARHWHWSPTNSGGGNTRCTGLALYGAPGVGRLPIGATSQVLQVVGGAPAWGGGYAAYTPAITQGVALTTSSLVARYQRLGSRVHAWGRAVISNSGTSGSPIVVALPVAGHASITTKNALGVGHVEDTGSLWVPCIIYAASVNAFTFRKTNADSESNVGDAGYSFGAVSGDTLAWNIDYEAA